MMSVVLILFLDSAIKSEVAMAGVNMAIIVFLVIEYIAEDDNRRNYENGNAFMPPSLLSRDIF